MSGQLQCIQVQKQLQHLDLEVIFFDFPGYIIKLRKNMLDGRFSRNNEGLFVTAILFLQIIEIYRKSLNILWQFFRCNVYLKANRNPVIVTKWKLHSAGMIDPTVHPEVASLQIAESIVPNLMFNPSFSAVIDTEQIRLRLETGNALLHVEVVIHEKYAGEHRI